MSLKKRTVREIIDKKKKAEKIVSITSYDYAFTKIVDQMNFDIILVGDSLSMVMLGYQNTLSVTMDEMIHHTKAVSRAVNNSLIVGDMPFLSYKISETKAVKNAGRFIQEGGAEAVKVEGGTEMCSTIKAIINADIEVMGHVGMTPQKIYRYGGFLVQGKTVETAKNLILDALNLQKAGVFSIVLESIPWQIAKLITKSLDIPTIGIGAGPHCDGQILVIHDLLGIFTDFKPKFLKYFGHIGDNMREALLNYENDVKSQAYPDLDHSYEFPNNEFMKVAEWLEKADLDKEAQRLKNHYESK
jgi:3-methyl-2-oxobutanoate hydroxymethyltransferase